MDSDELEPISAPDWVLRRLDRLATFDPLRFVRHRIPALEHRTIAEVLATPNGAHEVDIFLDRLEAKVGVKRNDNDFALMAGFDPTSAESHPGFERTNVRWVRHEDGWSVGFLSAAVAYRMGEQMAQADVDFDEPPQVTLKSRTLEWIAPRAAPLDDVERPIILQRLLSGMVALGADVKNQDG